MNFGSKPIWRSTVLACLALVAVSVTASAADSLDVILVKATNEGTSDAALKPYLGLLGRYGFTSYQAVATKAAPLKAGDVSLPQGFKATLGEGAGRRLPVTLSRGGKKLIRTTVTFAPKRPVVLGLYTGEAGAKMIVILVLAAQ